MENSQALNLMNSNNQFEQSPTTSNAQNSIAQYEKQIMIINKINESRETMVESNEDQSDEDQSNEDQSNEDQCK